MIRMTQDEYDNLNAKVRKARMTRDYFCRRILRGKTVKQAAPAEFPYLVRDYRRANNLLYQMLPFLETKNPSVALMVRKQLDEAYELDRLIFKTYIQDD